MTRQLTYLNLTKPQLYGDCRRVFGANSSVARGHLQLFLRFVIRMMRAEDGATRFKPFFSEDEAMGKAADDVAFMHDEDATYGSICWRSSSTEETSHFYSPWTMPVQFRFWSSAYFAAVGWPARLFDLRVRGRPLHGMIIQVDHKLLSGDKAVR